MSPVIDLIGSAKGFGWGALTASSSFESIASATGTGSSGTITFSSIPSTYQHLQIRYMAFVTSEGVDGQLRFNGDTASNYTRHRLGGNGTVTFASGNATVGGIDIGNDATGMSAGTFPTVSIIDIHDYKSTTKYKTVRNFNGIDKNGSGSVILYSGLWQSTSAITSLTMTLGSGAFTTASTFALYGIKG